MIIRDILNMKGGGIVSIGPEGAVADAVSMMVASDIGSLVVMQDGRMCGMITFREVLKILDSTRGSLAGVKVGDVMVADPIVGAPDETVDHLREVMTKNHVRYLPVRDGDTLLGVISFHDVAKAAISVASFENRLLKRYIKNWPEDETPPGAA
jgi:CBS domain-containing protein